MVVFPTHFPAPAGHVWTQPDSPHQAFLLILGFWNFHPGGHGLSRTPKWSGERARPGRCGGRARPPSRALRASSPPVISVCAVAFCAYVKEPSVNRAAPARTITLATAGPPPSAPARPGKNETGPPNGPTLT